MSNQTINNIKDIKTLVTPLDIKTYCSMSPNIQDVVFIPKIKLAQDLKLEIILGSSLYKRLWEEFTLANGVPSAIADGTTNADGINYKELYEYISPVLIWWSAYYSLDAIVIKVDEKGVNIHTSDYTAEVDRAAYTDKLKQYRYNAETYTEKLQCYLQEALKDDEDYEEEGDKNEGTTTFNIFFPSKRNKCNNCK